MYVCTYVCRQVFVYIRKDKGHLCLPRLSWGWRSAIHALVDRSSTCCSRISLACALRTQSTLPILLRLLASGCIWGLCVSGRGATVQLWCCATTVTTADSTDMQIAPFRPSTFAACSWCSFCSTEPLCLIVGATRRPDHRITHCFSQSRRLCRSWRHPTPPPQVDEACN